MKKLHRQIVLPYSCNNHTKNIGVIYRGVIDTAQAKIGDFKIEYLFEFEAICKKALTRISGA
jgi:hypothetical protein